VRRVAHPSRPLVARGWEEKLRIAPCYDATDGGFNGSVFLAAAETSKVLRITYSTGMKNRLRTVENNMPPTIAVPTECLPSLPAPVAKYNGSTPNRKAKEVIRMGRKRSSAASMAASVMERPRSIS